MNEQLLMKFIDVQTALLCPICPHIAEEIWVIRGKEGFAVSAPFPEAEEYDPVLIESSEFLSDTVRDARLKLKIDLGQRRERKKRKFLQTASSMLPRSIRRGKRPVSGFFGKGSKRTDRCTKTRLLHRE